MYDTLVAMVTLDHDLSPALFAGGLVTEEFDTGKQSARLWSNSDDLRVTYWVEARCLRVEASIVQLVHRVDDVTEAEKEIALDRINVLLAEQFGQLPDVRSWQCQRIDYFVTWPVNAAQFADYKHLFASIRVDGKQMQNYDNGLCWKSKSRWIKVYNTAMRGGDDRFKFEVSNHRTAVVYMCKAWFACERTVAELLQPGRALYVLAFFWQKLGLFSQAAFSSDELVAVRARRLYGRGAASALYHLKLIESYGNESIELKLTSSNSYYRWKKRLRVDGLISSDDERIVSSLEILELFNREHLSILVKNLKEDSALSALSAWKKFQKIWGVGPDAPEIAALVALLDGVYG
jgi:hypothetical protein